MPRQWKTFCPFLSPFHPRVQHSIQDHGIRTSWKNRGKRQACVVGEKPEAMSDPRSKDANHLADIGIPAMDLGCVASALAHRTTLVRLQWERALVA